MARGVAPAAVDAGLKAIAATGGPHPAAGTVHAQSHFGSNEMPIFRVATA
jgi:hypothetical protein